MPEFIVGKHHRILADMLMAIEQGGDKDRYLRKHTRHATESPS